MILYRSHSNTFIHSFLKKQTKRTYATWKLSKKTRKKRQNKEKKRKITSHKSSVLIVNKAKKDLYLKK